MTGDIDFVLLIHCLELRLVEVPSIRDSVLQVMSARTSFLWVTEPLKASANRKRCLFCHGHGRLSGLSNRRVIRYCCRTTESATVRSSETSKAVFSKTVQRDELSNFRNDSTAPREYKWDKHLSHPLLRSSASRLVTFNPWSTGQEERNLAGRIWGKRWEFRDITPDRRSKIWVDLF